MTTPSRFACCVRCSRLTAKKKPGREAPGDDTDHAACVLRLMCLCHDRNSGGSATLTLPTMEERDRGLSLLARGGRWEVEEAFLFEGERVTLRFPDGTIFLCACTVKAMGDRSLFLTIVPNL